VVKGAAFDYRVKRRGRGKIGSLGRNSCFTAVGFRRVFYCVITVHAKAVFPLGALARLPANLMSK